MRWVTYKHTLSWWWDDITVVDSNNQEVFYWAASVFFSSDITVRWKDGEEEILIPSSLSPMTIEWAWNNGFPYQIKGSWFLYIMTLN